MSVRLYNTCPNDTWRTLQPTVLKLGMEVSHDQKTTPVHIDVIKNQMSRSPFNTKSFSSCVQSRTLVRIHYLQGQFPITNIHTYWYWDQRSLWPL